MRGDYLDRMDGKLYVKNVDVDSRDPIVRSLWWTVLSTSGWLPCWFQADSSGEYCRQCGQRKDSLTHDVRPERLHVAGYDGRYGGTLENGARYSVTIDPRANAVKVENVPIPCPKVRAGIETRYYRGEWQKYLKAKGWITA